MIYNKTNQPTTEEFKQAVNTLDSMLQTYNSQISKSQGSIVRELLLRPLAFLYTSIMRILQSFVSSISIAKLKQSQLTQNETADLIASNYFTQRKQAQYASGSVAIRTTTQSMLLYQGTIIRIDNDYVFKTTQQYYVSSGDADASYTGSHIKSYRQSDNSYIFILPVTSTTAGYIEINTDAQIDASASIPGFQQASLVSPITGGGSVQTDQQLFQRIQSTFFNGARATTLALSARLTNAPVVPTGVSTVNSVSPDNTRAYYNTALITAGGAVDCYIKTANQLSIVDIQLTCSTAGTLTLTAETTQDYSGYTHVYYVRKSSSSTHEVDFEYSVTYTSSDSSVQASDARLSCLQCATITGNFVVGTAYIVRLQYAPGVYLDQAFINSDTNAFIGQSVLIKTALEVPIKLSLGISSTDTITQDTITGIKQDIAKLVNNSTVGNPVINMTNIIQSIRSSYPGIKFMLPFSFIGTIRLRDGQQDILQSTTGVLDLTACSNPQLFPYTTYYFSAVTDNIELDIV